MIKSYTLKDFKSFKEATLPLTPTVTFLIGANGSGKSNALEALRFLSWLVSGRIFMEIEEDVNSKHSSLRCPVKDIFYVDAKALEVSCIVDTEEDRYNYDILIEKTQKNQLKLKQEKLLNETSKKVLYSLDNKLVEDKAINDIVSFLKSSANSLRQALFWGLRLYSAFVIEKGLPQKKYKSLHLLEKGTKNIFNHLTSIFFLEPDPKEMRGYVQQFEGMLLSESGDNLSDVLEKLCRNKKIKKDILEMVCSLPEQKILDINFSKTEENWLMLRLDESFGDKRQTTPAYSLSDGTLRALTIATALFSVPEGSLLVIEEVDNGIHPSRIKHLVDKMYEIAAKRKIQILVTTHDPAMMNAIPPHEKGNVLCCYRSKEDGTSKILRLSDSPQYLDFLTNGQLGNLVSTEKFDDLVKTSQEERQKQHVAWFEEYQKEQADYLKSLEEEEKK